MKKGGVMESVHDIAEFMMKGFNKQLCRLYPISKSILLINIIYLECFLNEVVIFWYKKVLLCGGNHPVQTPYQAANGGVCQDYPELT